MLARTTKAALLAAIALAGAAHTLPAQEQERVEIRTGPGSRGWLGFTFRTEREGGPVIVERVLPGSPAERGGLAAGDTVVQIDGHAASDRAMDEMRTGLKPGDRVALTVRHAGSHAQRTVVAAARPGRNVAILGRTIRIQDDGHPDPVIIRLDSLGALPDAKMQRILDSLGIDLRGIRDLAQMRVRQFRVDIDTLEHGRMRVHLDSLSRHLDSLSFRMDSLRVRVRHAIPPAPEGDYVLWGPHGAVNEMEVQAQVLPARTYGSGAGVPFYLDLGRRALGGAELADLNDRLGSYFSIRQGALVLQVSPGTPASRAGLQPGDVVVRAGDHAVTSVADLRSALGRDDDGRLDLQVLRHGRRQSLQLQWDRGEMERNVVFRKRERAEVVRARERAHADERRQPDRKNRMDVNDDVDDEPLVLP